MNTDPIVPYSDHEKWRSEAFLMQSISAMLRNVLSAYGLDVRRAVSAAADIYESRISLEDIQAIWKWKIGAREHGYSDAEIDALLAHLYSSP